MRYANSGYGPQFAVLDVGLSDQVAVIEPNTGFWTLVKQEILKDALSGSIVREFLEESDGFKKEMHSFRFELKPSAVYFNPTERCNFNCPYCYLPEDMRRVGRTMSYEELQESLEKLLTYFRSHIPDSVKPQLIFHGSEPMIAKNIVLRAIEEFEEDFQFGIQTNGSLMDEESIEFLRKKGVGIGISLDAHEEAIADSIRYTWGGKGAFAQILKVIEGLSDYPAFNVITTVTRHNVSFLPELVDFYANHGVPMIMFNPVRLTQEGGRRLKPEDNLLAYYFLRALDRSQEIRQKGGPKLVIVNFANVLAGILGPTTRRLMCDISPCGGGRCFFAVSAKGDVFPCSEFIGLEVFKGGNIFSNEISEILASKPFMAVTYRTTEQIDPCKRCAIQHFCGAPCPAEVYALTGSLNAPAPYCAFYEEQVRYAFRVIARGEEKHYLWDGWEDETEETYSYKERIEAV
ncbi:MAG: peptide-modifying radical SAM enzyme CbpB [Syntrophobacterales bacterium]|nr:peptide-modifying radical SAM enzyme CbpB [Syntrophobacterales bacterium]